MKWTGILLCVGACVGTSVAPPRAALDADARERSVEAPGPAHERSLEVQRAREPTRRARQVHEPALATAGATPVERRAHDVLVRHCAQCHAGERPTAVPEALAAFDLDRPDWLAQFDGRRLEMALERLSGKPEVDQDALRALRDRQHPR